MALFYHAADIAFCHNQKSPSRDNASLEGIAASEKRVRIALTQFAVYGVSGVSRITIRTIFARKEICIVKMVDMWKPKMTTIDVQRNQRGIGSASKVLNRNESEYCRRKMPPVRFGDIIPPAGQVACGSPSTSSVLI